MYQQLLSEQGAESLDERRLLLLKAQNQQLERAVRPPGVHVLHRTISRL